MVAKVGHQKGQDIMVIAWSDFGTGFGELIIKKIEDGIYTVDTEMMDIDHFIKVIKALEYSPEEDKREQ